MSVIDSTVILSLLGEKQLEVLRLRGEVELRDARISELEQENASLRPEDSQVPEAQADASLASVRASA